MFSGLKRVFTPAAPDRSEWTTEQWYDHLMKEATSASERSDIEAMFARAR